jgi:hypothetical protein
MAEGEMCRMRCAVEDQLIGREAVRGYCVPFVVEHVCSTRSCARGTVAAER